MPSSANLDLDPALLTAATLLTAVSPSIVPGKLVSGELGAQGYLSSFVSAVDCSSSCPPMDTYPDHRPEGHPQVLEDIAGLLLNVVNILL